MGGRSVRGENPLRTARRTGRANRVHILDPQGLSPVFPTLQAVQGLGQSRWDWVADRRIGRGCVR